MTLVQHGRNPKYREAVVDEFVLIGDDNVKQIRWPLVIIQDVYPIFFFKTTKSEKQAICWLDHIRECIHWKYMLL